MVRIGLIGAGNWGVNLARVLNLSTTCKLAAIHDVNEAAAASLSRQYTGVKVFARASELIADVDAVVVATPISTHFPVAREVIEAGKHVFVEKPLAATHNEALELVRMAKERGVVLMSGHTFMYTPAVVRIKEEIDSGRLGDISYITMQRVNLGRFSFETNASTDLAVHDISILLYWLGEMPIAAASFGRDCLQKGTQDVSFLWFKFPSGVVASVEVSWLSPRKLRRTCVVGSTRTVVYDDAEPSEKVKIYNSNVELQDPTTFGEYQLHYRIGDVLVPYLKNVEPLQVELEHFASCVKTGSKPLTDGEFGAKVLKVLEMATSNPMLPAQNTHA